MTVYAAMLTWCSTCDIFQQYNSVHPIICPSWPRTSSVMNEKSDGHIYTWPANGNVHPHLEIFESDAITIQAIFLYCWPGCPSCPANTIRIYWATWAIQAAIEPLLKWSSLFCKVLLKWVVYNLNAEIPQDLHFSTFSKRSRRSHEGREWCIDEMKVSQLSICWDNSMAVSTLLSYIGNNYAGCQPEPPARGYRCYYY